MIRLLSQHHFRPQSRVRRKSEQAPCRSTTCASTDQRFPFDKIKIDRCFVTDITEPAGGGEYCRGTSHDGDGRGRRDSAATGTAGAGLRSEMQGYLFSPPEPAADIKQLLFAQHQQPHPRAGCESASVFQATLKAQFATAVFGDGLSALTVTPRRRLYAAPSALSSFSFGGT